MLGRLLWGFAIFLGLLTLTFAYEEVRHGHDVVTTGEVVNVRLAFRDSREYLIQFRHEGRVHRFATRLGFSDWFGRFGRFSDLEARDSVPVAFDPDDPSDAHVDTFGETHHFSTLLIPLACIWVAVILYVAVTGRGPPH